MNNVNEKKVMSDKEIQPMPSDYEIKEWFVILFVAVVTIPLWGWWASIVIFLTFGWAADRATKRVNSPLFRKDPIAPNPKAKITTNQPKDYSWERDFVSGNFDPEPEPAPEPKLETLVITDHARRNLALRHGVITDRKHVRFEDMTSFEEEGEGCFTMTFPDLNKSKKFAVFLSEDKSVIKTFMPHTDSNRNRAYFKKHANLDSSLKDDLTKDLDFLQKVWLDKLSS